MSVAPSLHLSVDVFQPNRSTPEFVEIDTTRPDKVKITFGPVDSDEEFEAAQVIATGIEMYLRFPGSPGGWVSIPLNHQIRDDVQDIASFLKAVFRTATELAYLGAEEVDGMLMYHLKADIGPTDLRLVPGIEDERAAADLWIGVEDSLLYLLRLETRPKGEIIAIRFSIFDRPIVVDPPEDIVSITDLESISGGAIVGTLLGRLSEEQQDCLREEMGNEKFEELVEGTPEIGLMETVALQVCVLPADLLAGVRLLPGDRFRL